MRTPGFRVLLTTESDVLGGAERMIVSLARHLIGRGVDVHFAGRPIEQGYLMPTLAEIGAEVHVVPMRPRRPIETAVALGRLVRRIQPDVLHAHMIALSVYGSAVGRVVGVPTIITLHGTGHEVATAVRRTALRGAIRLSRTAVAVSAALRIELISELGSVARRCIVVPNGSDHTPGNRDAVRRELGVGESELLLVAVGNLLPVKGHDVLIAAMAFLRERQEWRLVIAGREGGLGQQLAEQVRSLGLGGRIQLLGERSDVGDLLSAADIFVHPSRNEAMPMAVIEAMHHGLPIVASDVGGIPELVKNGESGRLVAADDPKCLARAIEELLNSPWTRRQLGEAARKTAHEEFSAHAMSNAYIEHYENLSDRRLKMLEGIGAPQ